MNDFHDTDPYRTNTGDLDCDEAPAAIGTLRRRGGEIINCAICGEEAPMISAEEAATINRISRRVIYMWIDIGAMHFIETPDGKVMVCENSLAGKLDDAYAQTLLTEESGEVM